MAETKVNINEVSDRISWWEEIGRTTLTVAGDTVSVSSLPARKYLKIYASLRATGGVADLGLRFNNDTATNYSARYDSGGVHASAVSVNHVSMDSGTIASGGVAIIEALAINIAAYEKVFNFATGSVATAGAATAPAELQGVGKWANTSVQINRVDIVNLGAGDFAIGSEVIVLGHD